PLRLAAYRGDLEKHVDEGAIGEHGNLVRNRLRIWTGIIDSSNSIKLPGAVEKTRKPGGSASWRVVETLQSIPDGIHQTRLERIRGNRLLIHRNVGALVASERDWFLPG